MARLSPHVRRDKGRDGRLETFGVELEHSGHRRWTFLSLRTGPPERMASEAGKLAAQQGATDVEARPFLRSTDGRRLMYLFPRDRRIRGAGDLSNARKVRRLLADHLSGRFSKSRSQPRLVTSLTQMLSQKLLQQ